MDIQSITSGFTGIRAAYEAWKIISNSSPTLSQADNDYAKALLSRSLTDAIIELNDKNLKIQDLETQLKKKTSVKFERPFYFSIEDVKKENPLCKHCFDKDSKLINLEPYPGTEWYCTVCHNLFDTNPRQRVVAHNIDSDYSSYGEQGWMR